MNRFLPAALSVALLGTAVAAPENLAPVLEPILESSGLPSIAAAVTDTSETLALGATGIRKLGEKSAVSATDRYHLGSCTKSFTSTLAAILVEEGRIEWETTIGEIFGKRISDLHASHTDVTLEQLLAHVGGFPWSATPQMWAQAWDAQNEGMAPKKQRLQYITALLTRGAEYPAGTRYEYSNQGYAVAGVMLEIVGKKPWETLVRERIFKPLGMKSAGFRAPEGKNAWGHKDGAPTFTDNPDAIGPAGTIHSSLGDWAKFIRFHLARKTGTLLRDEASFDKLHSTLPKSGNHAVGGWIAGKNGEFFMTGSNKHWTARFEAYPDRDIAVLTATNSAEDGARETLEKIEDTLLTKFRSGP